MATYIYEQKKMFVTENERVPPSFLRNCYGGFPQGEVASDQVGGKHSYPLKFFYSGVAYLCLRVCVLGLERKSRE